MLAREITEPQPELLEQLIEAGDPTRLRSLQFIENYDDPIEVYMAFETLVGGHTLATPRAFFVYALARLWDRFSLTRMLDLTKELTKTQSAAEAESKQKGKKKGKRGTKASKTDVDQDDASTKPSADDMLIRSQEVLCSLVDVFDELIQNPLVLQHQDPILQISLYLPRVLRTLRDISSSSEFSIESIEVRDCILAHKTMRKLAEAVFQCASTLASPTVGHSTDLAHVLGTTLEESRMLASFVARSGDYTIQGSVLEALLMTLEAALRLGLGGHSDSDQESTGLSQVSEAESAKIVEAVLAAAQELRLRNIEETIELLPRSAINCWAHWLRDKASDLFASGKAPANPRRLRQSKNEGKQTTVRPLARLLMQLLSLDSEIPFDGLDSTTLAERAESLSQRAVEVAGQRRMEREGLEQNPADERLGRVRALLSILNTTDRSQVRQFECLRVWFTKNAHNIAPSSYSMTDMLTGHLDPSSRASDDSPVPRYPEPFVAVAFPRRKHASYRPEDVIEDKSNLLAVPDAAPVEIQIGASSSLVFCGGGGELTRLYGVPLAEFLDSVITDVVSLEYQGSSYATVGVLTLVGRCSFIPDENRGSEVKSSSFLVTELRAKEHNDAEEDPSTALHFNRSLRLLFLSVDKMEECLAHIKRVLEARRSTVALYRGDPQSLSSPGEGGMTMSQSFTQAEFSQPMYPYSQSRGLVRSPNIDHAEETIEEVAPDSYRELHGAISQAEAGRLSSLSAGRLKPRRKLSHATMEKLMGLGIEELARAVEETIELFASGDSLLTTTLSSAQPSGEATSGSTSSSSSSTSTSATAMRDTDRAVDSMRVLEAIHAANSVSQDADVEAESNAGDDQMGDVSESPEPTRISRSPKQLRSRRRSVRHRQTGSPSSSSSSSQEMPEPGEGGPLSISSTAQRRKWSTTSPAALQTGAMTPMSDSVLRSPPIRPSSTTESPGMTERHPVASGVQAAAIVQASVAGGALSSASTTTAMAIRSKRRRNGSSAALSVPTQAPPAPPQQEQPVIERAQKPSKTQSKRERNDKEKSSKALTRVPLGQILTGATTMKARQPASIEQDTSSFRIQRQPDTAEESYAYRETETTYPALRFGRDDSHTPSRSAAKPVFAQVPKLRNASEDESDVSSEGGQSYEEGLPPISAFDIPWSRTLARDEDTTEKKSGGLGQRRGRPATTEEEESSGDVSPFGGRKRIQFGHADPTGGQASSTFAEDTASESEFGDFDLPASSLEALFQQAATKRRDMLRRWSTRMEQGMEEGIASLLENAKFELKALQEQTSQVLGIGVLEEATQLAESGIAQLLAGQQAMRRMVADSHELVGRAAEAIRKQSQQFIDSIEEVQRIRRRAMKHLSQELHEHRDQLLQQLRKD